MSEAATETREIATLTVTPEEHFRFAAFSGDQNPMHTDAVFARRTLPGAIATYGMHLLLWALNALAEQGLVDADLRRIRVRFVRWVYLGATVRLVVESVAPLLPQRVELFVDEVLAVVIHLAYNTPASETAHPLHGDAPHTRRLDSAERGISTLEGIHGAVAGCSAEQAASLFPALARVLGAGLAADIATVSYVVGMEAPGLHSIDSRADWTLHRSTPAEEPVFAYRVTAVDERFRLANIAVAGSVLRGEVQALVRRPPVPQMSLADVRTLVNPGEFKRMHALVIGGSRGVGEATAKLLLAGGAEVTLTYAQGKTEAEALLAEARQADVPLHVAQLDVLEKTSFLPACPQPWTHLFYFATGPMFQKHTAADAERTAQKMHAMYVEAFVRVMDTVPRSAGVPPAVFYPSTDGIGTAAQEHETFTRAKLAGEAACRAWSVNQQDAVVVVERLPRMRTDQTASVLPQREAEATDVMLPILRRLALLQTHRV